MNRRFLILAAIVISWAARTLSAQELTTDAERSYRELRKSHDTTTQLLAERWYGAIKLQEWTDATGRFTTTAKYLAHDPELAWVKLRVIEGSGDKRVVKDVTIPVSKLSKASQSRVRQIGVLAEKVTAAAAAEKEKESTEKPADGAASPVPEGRMMADEPGDGRGGRAAGLAGMDAEEALAEGGGKRRPRPARTAARRPSPRSKNRAPLPALLPPLPGGAARLGVSAEMPDASQAAPAEHGER